MSYESMITVAEKCERSKTSIFEMHLATMELCQMEEGFRNIFTKPVTWERRDMSDTDITTDKYGDICKYADIDTVIEYLEKRIAGGDTYRRLKPCLAMLKAYKDELWDYPLIVIHYGY